MMLSSYWEKANPPPPKKKKKFGGTCLQTYCKQVALLSQRGRATARSFVSVSRLVSFISAKGQAQSFIVSYKLQIYHCVQLNAVLLSLV